jgi:RNA polymerase sigma-70 factor (ECF subfamily)
MDLHDEEAFLQFFRQWKDPIKIICLRYLRRTEDVEDAISEILTKLWLARDGLDKVNNVGGYVYVTATNHCREIIKRAGRKIALIPLATDALTDHIDDANAWCADEQEAGVYSAWLKQLLYEGMEDLPPKRKEVMLLHYQDDLLPEEIAGRLKVRVSVVYDHLRKGRQKLLELFRKKKPPPEQ